MDAASSTGRDSDFQRPSPDDSAGSPFSPQPDTGCTLHKARDIRVSADTSANSTYGILDVPPLAGRLVLFLSGAVDHAVLPNHCERIALTAWMQ